VKRRHPASSRPGTGGHGLPATLIAAAVGMLCAVVGMVTVTLGEQGCQVAFARPWCDGASVVVIITAAAAMVYVGLALLTRLDVPDPAITSVLGFALFAIVLLTDVLDRIVSAYLWGVLPFVAGLTYAIGAWIAAALERIGS
jgi:hypothetical protein